MPIHYRDIFFVKSSSHQGCKISGESPDLQLVSPGGDTRLHLVQPLDQLSDFGPALVLQSILVGEDGLEDRQELRGQLPDSRVFPFV